MIPWGMDEHGEPVDPQYAAISIIEDAIRSYIKTGLATMECQDHDARTLRTLRHLHLSEPHLPAVRALEALREAGLIHIHEE